VLEHERTGDIMEYDESTNPSNGWREPEMPDELAESFQDLQPNEGNPLESAPLVYNPLNHAYPMIANTSVGIIEVMVQFSVVRGENLPIDMIGSAKELQVPVAIEDVPISQSGFSEDTVAESALVDEIQGGHYYLIPVIVRARRFSGGEQNNVDSWEPLTADDVASIISGPALLDLIIGYADKVAADPDAPAGLLDLLDHFTGRAGQIQRQTTGVSDEEWNSDIENN
jgi:hypothetical protein